MKKRAKTPLQYGKKLKRILQENEESQTKFAVVMRVSKVTVNNSWIKRSVKPRLFTALKINAYTNRTISMQELGYQGFNH